MRKCRRLFIMISVCLIMFLSACTGTQVASTDSPQVIVYTNIEVSPSDIERVKKETEHAINSISPILGVKKPSIKIRITEKGICHTSGGVIYLPIWHVQNRKAAIVHEATHIMAKHQNNRFFSEGLAVYFQERFGEDNGFPNFSGVALDDLMRNHQEQYIPIKKLINDNEVFRQVGTKRREIAYIEAGSFMNFLVVKYGEQKLTDLHNSWTLNYKKIYGKSIQELETEWRDLVFM